MRRFVLTSTRTTRIRGLLAAKLRDTSGSSLILALAFFILCAIIGSIVLTAASANTQATVTYEETQQAEYTVTSAARFVGERFEDTGVAFSYPAASSGDDTKERKPVFADTTYSDNDGLLSSIWETYGEAIWDSASSGTAFTITDPFSIAVSEYGSAIADTVYFQVTFDRDFNIAISFSLDANRGSSKGDYNKSIALQAIPRFDAEGKLIALGWGSYTIVKDDAIDKPVGDPSGGEA